VVSIGAAVRAEAPVRTEAAVRIGDHRVKAAAEARFSHRNIFYIRQHALGVERQRAWFVENL
jgi:hypothetical protein